MRRFLRLFRLAALAAALVFGAFWLFLPVVLEYGLPVAARHLDYEMTLKGVSREKADVLKIEDLYISGPGVRAEIKSIGVSLVPWFPFLERFSLEAPSVELNDDFFTSPSKMPGIPLALFKTAEVGKGRVSIRSGGSTVLLSSLSVYPASALLPTRKLKKKVKITNILFDFFAKKGSLGVDGSFKGDWEWLTSRFSISVQGRSLKTEYLEEAPFSLACEGRLGQVAGRPRYAGGNNTAKGSRRPSAARFMLPPGKNLFLKGTIEGTHDGDKSAPSGIIGFTVDLSAGGSSTWRASAVVEGSGIAWAKDFERACEDVAFRMKLHAGSLEPQPLESGNMPLTVSWDADLEWKRGAVLYAPWFFDLSDLSGKLKMSGTVSDEFIGIDSVRAEGPFSLAAGGMVIKTSEFGKPVDPWKKITEIKYLAMNGNLERAYRVLVSDPFGMRRPVLNRIRPSGNWTVSADGGSGALSVAVKADVGFEDRYSVRGLRINVSYPFVESQCNPGRLSWTSFFLPPFDFGKGSVPLVVCGNAVHAGPLKVPLASGFLALEDAFWQWKPPEGGMKGLAVSSIDMKSIRHDIPVGAIVSGKLGRGVWRNGRLNFSGELAANMAGGTVVVKDPWIEPMSTIPRFGADVAIEGLDLARITEKTSFGRISGVLQGHIDRLVISGNQPEAFSLVLRTDPDAKGPRKISIQALDSISILGGGGRLPLAGTFFRNYSYRAIALSCTLDNDVFLLKGLIKKDGREYLVQRGFLGGVNVINRNPEGRISFKDMLARLKRIGSAEQAERR